MSKTQQVKKKNGIGFNFRQNGVFLSYISIFCIFRGKKMFYHHENMQQK